MNFERVGFCEYLCAYLLRCDDRLRAGSDETVYIVLVVTDVRDRVMYGGSGYGLPRAANI